MTTSKTKVAEEKYVDHLNMLKDSLKESYISRQDMLSLSEERSQGYLCSHINPNTNLCGLHAVNNLLKKSCTLDKTMPYFTIEDMNEAIDHVTRAFANELKPESKDDPLILQEIPNKFPRSYKSGMSRKELFEGYVHHAVGVKDVGPISPRVLNTMLRKRGLMMRNISQPVAIMDPKKFDDALKLNDQELKIFPSFKFTSLFHRKELRLSISNEDFEILRRARMNLILMCWKYDKETDVATSTDGVGHFICVTSDGKMFDNTIDFEASCIAQKLENVHRDAFTLENVAQLGVPPCNEDEGMWFSAYEIVSQDTFNIRAKKFGHPYAEGLLHEKDVPGCSSKKGKDLMSIFEQNKYWMHEGKFTRSTYEAYPGLADEKENCCSPTKKPRLTSHELFPYFVPPDADECKIKMDDEE